MIEIRAQINLLFHTCQEKYEETSEHQENNSDVTQDMMRGKTIKRGRSLSCIFSEDKKRDERM